MQVELGSQSCQTLTFRQTLNPSYYEAIEMEVILPELMELAPDIVVWMRLLCYTAIVKMGCNSEFRRIRKRPCLESWWIVMI